MISLDKGKIENVVVDVEDRAGSLLTIEGTAPKFSVRPRFGDDDSWILTDENATPDNLRAFCLIDTTNFTNWPKGEYELYIEFDNLPEVPRLGPMHFELI